MQMRINKHFYGYMCTISKATQKIAMLRVNIIMDANYTKDVKIS